MIQATEAIHANVRVGRQGRIVIPALVRERLGIHEGDELIVRVENGRLILQTREQLWAELHALFAHIPPNVSLADELIAERRAEARREERE